MAVLLVPLLAHLGEAAALAVARSPCSRAVIAAGEFWREPSVVSVTMLRRRSDGAGERSIRFLAASSFEAPDLLTDDIRAFFHLVRGR